MLAVLMARAQSGELLGIGSRQVLEQSITLQGADQRLPPRSIRPRRCPCAWLRRLYSDRLRNWIAAPRRPFCDALDHVAEPVPGERLGAMRVDHAQDPGLCEYRLEYRGLGPATMRGACQATGLQ